MDVFNMERPTGRAQFGRIFPPSAEWLRKQPVEAAIEPDLPIVDTHHHLWDVPNNRYLINEFVEDLSGGHNIIATVFLETLAMYRASGPVEMRPVGETEFANGVAAMSASGRYGRTKIAAGIVGFADLTLGAGVESVLTAHVAAGGGRFRGVRHSGGWDADPIIGNSPTARGPGLFREPAFREGVACLQALGLSFDAWVFHPQLGDVADLAKAFPELEIVLGHAGGILGYGRYAGRRDEVFAQWKTSMTQIAACPNVSVKLGGLVKRLAAFDYLALEAPPTSEQLATYWRPYIETCVELFGADRCMFESNFPVDKLGTGYTTLWNAFKRITAGVSASEKLALYSGTARRVYRLSEQ
ncbi:amidohydrolase [Caballeronia sp. GaOx3]|uniref:amidohydrolase family protein n=1 Tax=Caballeronia sp. GaOx3 TaxID=2921740 RepID=UPI002027CD69|nr:amidohydrolase family protein [Caballeronia sp. GaOx3]